MNVKKIIHQTKEKAKKIIEDYNDPEKRKEREIQRAKTTIILAKKGVAAYQAATEAANKAKNNIAKTVKNIEPITENVTAKAEEVLKTGKEHVGELVKKWQAKDKKSANDAASSNCNNKANNSKKPKM